MQEIARACRGRETRRIPCHCCVDEADAKTEAMLSQHGTGDWQRRRTGYEADLKNLMKRSVLSQLLPEQQRRV